ncbi:MAG: nucleotide exchange factor GrpE [Eubacteriales bacterium]|nr:nucleotide exchange factor GrpE [Eubacteriales bacterium]
MEKQELNQELQEEKKENVEETMTEETAAVETEKTEETQVSEEISAEELAKQEIARLMQENSEKEDAYRRMLAEFDNYRKRSIKEKEMMFEKGAADIIESLLPILDDFDRAFQHLPEEKDSVISGMEMVFKKMITTLEGMGVEEIKALGEEFDHDLHSAISHEENPDFGENIVSEVYQKGYLYKGKVIRHSVVKVAN